MKNKGTHHVVLEMQLFWLRYMIVRHLNQDIKQQSNLLLIGALFKTKLLRTIAFRNIKSIDPAALDIGIASLPNINFTSTPDELLSHYYCGLHNLLDTLAPLKTQTVSFSQSAPWFTSELSQRSPTGTPL